MTEKQKVWIDPPSGWQFGYPKLVDYPFTDEDVVNHLVENKYSLDLKMAIKHLRVIFPENFEYVS